jgi:hypothetical protein
MMDLNFENGFWLPTGFPEENELAVDNMWKNFKKYCTENYKFVDSPIMHGILLRKFNACVQTFADEDHDDDQYFVRFNTPEDYTFFVMRFG